MKTRLTILTRSVALFLGLAGSQAFGITLDQLLQTTLEKNHAIQQAKAGLEVAAGERVVLRSIMWPNARVVVPGGVQGGKRAGSNTKGFVFARGIFTQPLFNAAIPASLRRSDIDLLIAQQQLNVTTVQQLHTARLAFYSAQYNRSLLSLRGDQRQKLDENISSQQDRYQAGLVDRNAIAGATLEARELDPQVESARRAYREAQLTLAEAMGSEPGADEVLPEPDGDLQFNPTDNDLEPETSAALERRVDLKLARLMVRAASEDQRIIEAGYYPLVSGAAAGNYIPITGVHREGSTRRTDDFISSEVRIGATYTWRVIDSGKTLGAARKQRAAREINEITVKKLETNLVRELSRIHNNLESIATREHSLSSATNSADESSRIVAENLAGGLVSQLEYRLTQSGYLETKSGLLNSIYDYNVAQAEWDRATGRYFQFSEDTAPNVH